MATESNKVETVPSEKEQKDPPSSSSADKAEKQAEGGGDSLEDLCLTLKNQIASTNWLQENTAEKWTKENPELAKIFSDAANKS